MAYTLIDLMEKLAGIERNGCAMYRMAAQISDADLPGFKTAAAVLAAEEERHITFYESKIAQLKLEEEKALEIDFSVYDTISGLVSLFEKRMAQPHVSDAKSLLKFALNFEKENLALLLDIQGRLVKTRADAGSFSYTFMMDMIEEEKKHISNLNRFVR